LKTPNESGITDVPLEMEHALISYVGCDDIGSLLDIKQVDFDRFNIRSDAEYELAKIKTFMELYPQTRITIRSHTDSRAPDSYNIILSDNKRKAHLTGLYQKVLKPYV
jgi:outer membrane protein OmpA-like peptidoglycan-associated protein